MSTALSPLKRGLTWAECVLKFAGRYLLLSFQPAHWKPTKAPEIAVENTSVCNARCIFCANGVMERPRIAMKEEVFRKTVDEAILLGSDVIDFSVMIGDPLLDKKLLERARYIKKFPQVREMGMTTTLQWLHLFDLNEFFESGFTWVAVSTTLSGRERYRDFFGVDKYDQMLTNLQALLNENNKRGKPIEVAVNVKPTPEPRRDILNHPDFMLVQSLTTQNLRKTVKREAFFVFDWAGAVRLPSYLRLHPLWPRKRRPCGRLLRHLMVYSNGKVGACNCVDFEASSDLILGNIEQTSLVDMWNGTRLKQLQSDWRSGKSVPSACQLCRMYRPGPAN